MPEKNEKAAPEAQEQQMISFDALNEKIQARYQDLLKALNAESNMANRYEIKLRIEELAEVAKIIFSR